MKRVIICMAIVFTLILSHQLVTKTNLNWKQSRGDIIGKLNNVPVYFNGGVGQVSGRNLSENGYNIGLNWQCVEFIKRYYLEHYNHEMPDSYGHAKSFFDKNLADGALNNKRELYQYRNGGVQPPKSGDIIVFAPTLLNRFGHVAIISKVEQSSIEYIGQNHSPFSKAHKTLNRHEADVMDKRVLGWLRLTP